jgi:hypothetical protein
MKSILVLLSALYCTFLLSCENNFSNKELSSIATDTVSITGFTGDSVKLVKTADIQFKVSDVHVGSKEISELAKELEGMITHLNIESRQDDSRKLKVSNDSLLQVSIYNTSADITARIPSKNLEDFLFQVSDIGYFTFSQTMDIDDKSLEYLSSHLKQENRMHFLKSVGNKNIKGATSYGLIDTKDEAIENEMAKRQIDANVKYSVVKLQLYQNPIIRKELITNDSIEDYGLPFSRNLRNALNAGWEMFQNFILALAHLWMFILGGMLIWFPLKHYRQSRSAAIVKN